MDNHGQTDRQIDCVVVQLAASRCWLYSVNVLPFVLTYVAGYSWVRWPLLGPNHVNIPPK